MVDFAITFAAGASYGLTTVLVGQPLDTIKTRSAVFSRVFMHGLLVGALVWY